VTEFINKRYLSFVALCCVTQVRLRCSTNPPLSLPPRLVFPDRGINERERERERERKYRERKGVRNIKEERDIKRGGRDRA
jgi:hypothetical protein